MRRTILTVATLVAMTALVPSGATAHPSTIHTISGWGINSAGDQLDFGAGYTMLAHGTLLVPPAPVIEINGSDHLVRCSRNDFTGSSGAQHIVGIAAVEVGTATLRYVFIYDNGPFDEFIVTPTPGFGPCNSPIQAWMTNSLPPVTIGPGFAVV